MGKSTIYKIQFINQGRVYEVYARNVHQGEMFGFLVIENLVFGERTSVVVDPSEERIKSEFAGVNRTHIPLHAVIRIDEVSRQGVPKITEASSNIAEFPVPLYTPGGDREKKS